MRLRARIERERCIVAEVINPSGVQKKIEGIMVARIPGRWRFPDAHSYRLRPVSKTNLRVFLDRRFDRRRDLSVGRSGTPVNCSPVRAEETEKGLS